jgi:error-prone DNA polymerase
MRSHRDAPELPFGVLADHAAGLIALSACDRGELRRALGTGGEAAARAVAHRYRDAFGRDGYFVELHNHLRQADGPRNAALARVAAAVGVGIVATNNAHYAAPDRALLHHVVTAIRHRTTLEEAGDLLRPNDENYLKTPAQMARLFADYPEALRATLAIAERCRFGLVDLRYRFPAPEVPPGETAYSWLVTCVEEGRRRFYPYTDAAALARLEHELEIVRRLDLAGYLLVFKDIVDYCRREGILVSIRGSAPASALLYCLGLCPIDPVRHNLVFERFASLERDELPDIDLDIEHERREEVIQYVYGKYGRTHAAMVCEVNTYRLKSAVRDVAKALGVPHAEALRLSTSLDERDLPDGLVGAVEGPAVTGIGHPRDSTTRVARLAADRAASGGCAAIAPPAEGTAVTGLLVPLVRQLLDSPRHLSIHVGGFVVSARPLSDVVPIEPARMPGRSIIPWDKDDLTLLAEEFGVNLVKMDLLGLGMLSLISRCFRLIEEESGQRLDLHGFAYDPGVFDLLCSADTVGLFQVESRAQMAFLPQLRPRSLPDVAISVGAIRPGPGACQAGKHIALRRLGRERVTYPAPELKPVLEETLGVVLWQEQVMQVAMVMAGYSGGEADRLRRAMSSKRSVAGIEAASRDLVDRVVARGHPRELAEDLKKMIAGFAGYGFPRAHAYPFAHLALVSATLKLRHPAAFYASLLNAQPMGFYAPHTIVWDAHRHGVRVLPVDVNASAWESTVEDARTVRLGLKQVEGLGPAARAAIEPARADGPFGSLADVVARTGLARDDLEALAGVGAFLGFADRRTALWQVGELAGLSGPRYLPGLAPLVAERADLPAMTAWEETRADYAGLGFSVDKHVVEYFRPALRAMRTRSAAELPGLPKNLVVRVGGLVITRQRPETAKGFTFLTIEDETGLVNVIVAPAVYEKQRGLVRAEPLLVVEGLLQKDDVLPHGGAINVIARRFWPLRDDADAAASAARVPSHDFR